MVNIGPSFEQTMMDPRFQCYIPSHKDIGPLVLKKKVFEGFLPYMSVAAILVMWPRPREQTFVPLIHWGSIGNLALIGRAVLEKKIFENGGRTDDGAWLYYKLTNEPNGSGELKILYLNNFVPTLHRSKSHWKLYVVVLSNEKLFSKEMY